MTIGLADGVRAPHEWVLHHAGRDPDAPAIGTPSTWVTYGELRDRVLGLAGDLAAHGIGPGDRVVVALPNAPAMVIAGLAIGAIGATSVEVNRTWSEAVLRDIIDRTRGRAVLLWGRDARTWGPILATAPVELVRVVHPGPIPDALRAALGRPDAEGITEDGSGLETHPALPVARSASPDETALVLFTSGSTGTPQGVLQTVRNLDANTRSIVGYLRLTSADRAMLTLPLYYCYGRSVLQTHLAVGGSVFLDHRFALPRVVMEAIVQQGCTGFAGVPLTFEVLRRQVDVAEMELRGLRYVTQAGGAMTPGTTAWVRTAFAPADLIVMYGQTEATARLAWLPPERASQKPGSMGIAIPGVELRVVDDAGHDVPQGVAGNLIARGANVTPGYLDDPEATAEILRDGWLWTGDLAIEDDDGFLFHQGRAREILKVGGHRVSPAAIEEVVRSYPGIAEAGVVGTPDDLLGEVPVAFIVADDTGLDPAGLRDHCLARLPAIQVPRAFHVVASLPRSESGKLLRPALRAWALGSARTID